MNKYDKQRLIKLEQKTERLKPKNMIYAHWPESTSATSKCDCTAQCFDDPCGEFCAYNV